MSAPCAPGSDWIRATSAGCCGRWRRSDWSWWAGSRAMEGGGGGGWGQRARLVQAMAEVERLIDGARIEVRVESPTSDDARRCLDAYFRELARLFDPGFDPSKSNPATDETLIPPAGSF